MTIEEVPSRNPITFEDETTLEYKYFISPNPEPLTKAQIEANPVLAKKLTTNSRNPEDPPLTAQQLTLANLLLDFSDTRTTKTKLRICGVSPTQYQAWLKFPPFQNYLRYRSEMLLPESLHEVHSALIKKAVSGNVPAMKLYYEITGRHDPQSRDQANFAYLLTRLVEAVQTHVQDPKVLQELSKELHALGNAANPRAAVASPSPYVPPNDAPPLT